MIQTTRDEISIFLVWMCHIQLTSSGILLVSSFSLFLNQLHFSVCSLSHVKMVWWNSGFSYKAGPTAYFYPSNGKEGSVWQVRDWLHRKIDCWYRGNKVFSPTLLTYIHICYRNYIIYLYITFPLLIITHCAVGINKYSKQQLKALKMLFRLIKTSLLHSLGNTQDIKKLRWFQNAGSCVDLSSLIQL